MRCPISCGNCCKKLADSIRFSFGDIKRWKEQERQDILRRIEVFCQVKGEGVFLRGDNKLIDDAIVFGGEWNKGYVDVCPFLKEDKCSIQDTKPQTCTDYLCEKAEPLCAEQLVPTIIERGKNWKQMNLNQRKLKQKSKQMT